MTWNIPTRASSSDFQTVAALVQCWRWRLTPSHLEIERRSYGLFVARLDRLNEARAANKVLPIAPSYGDSRSDRAGRKLQETLNMSKARVMNWRYGTYRYQQPGLASPL
ncbi:hypothetical protein LAD67_10010 [Escherichia coli]|nr:hypothetical protein [Escherichia coli]